MDVTPFLNWGYARLIGGEKPRFLNGKCYNDGSCIWADIREYSHKDKFKDIKQVFGHSVQVYFDGTKIVFGDAIKVGNVMMLDNGQAHELNTETFDLIY